MLCLYCFLRASFTGWEMDFSRVTSEVTQPFFALEQSSREDEFLPMLHTSKKKFSALYRWVEISSRRGLIGPRIVRYRAVWVSVSAKRVAGISFYSSMPARLRLTFTFSMIGFSYHGHYFLILFIIRAFLVLYYKMASGCSVGCYLKPFI